VRVCGNLQCTISILSRREGGALYICCVVVNSCEWECSLAMVGGWVGGLVGGWVVGGGGKRLLLFR
jgi:hypothetical protein